MSKIYVGDELISTKEASELSVASTADTGAPHFIPYIDGGAPGSLGAADEAQAEAVADALDAAGGLVAVKSALKKNAQSFTNVAPGANIAVPDLTITHALADAGNRLIISAFLGVAANSGGEGNVGIAVHDGTGFIAIGNAAGSMVRVTAGGNVSGTGANFVVTMPSVTFVHTPGDTDSRTYTVHAFSVDGYEKTLYINRAENEYQSPPSRSRGVSSLVIQEVKV